MIEKKSARANLELRRGEMFLVAMVMVLSFVFVALEWDASVAETDYDEALEDLIEDIDLSKLKKNSDMVAAISEAENQAEVTKVKPVEMVTQQPQEATTSKLLIGDGEAEIPEAKVEEVKPQVLETEKDDLPEGLHVVEQMPEFPGGATAFMKWITANLQYPENARDRKIEGKVVVSFIVGVDGSVSKIILERNDNRQLGVAVLSLMNKMPKWKPGKQGGKPCATKVAVPINFEL